MFLLILAVPVTAEKTVAVRSVVDPAYAARRAQESPPRTETYVFVRGKYFNLIPMDSYLERISFRTIAATLATDLRKQSYEPAKNLLEADLLLLVHWGVTMANERNAELFAQDPDGLRLAREAYETAVERMENPATREQLKGILEPVMESGLDLRREESGNAAAYRKNEPGGYTNAELLGLQSDMARENGMPFSSALGDTLRLMANEERYFIIVTAYDAAVLRQSGRKKRLWTTRLSIRAAGVNFAVALDRLSGIGAHFHGKPSEGLAFETSADRANASRGSVKIGEGSVQVGELTVIGEEPVPRPGH